MRTFIFLAIMITLFGWINNSKLSAQEVVDKAYYRHVTATIDTISCNPKSNRVVLHAGAQWDWNNYGPYFYGRINVSKFVLTGFVAMLPQTNYNVQEAVLVFCFGGSSQRKNDGKARVTTEDVGFEEVYFKTGGTDKIISARSFDRKTEYHDYGTGADMIRHEWGTENVISKVKHRASVAVPKYTVAGLSLGAYHWQRNQGKAGIVDVMGLSFGLNAYINRKARYKFNYQEHVNDVEVLGVGKFTETPTDSIRRSGIKRGRTNRSVDIGMEFFYAPLVQFENPQERLYAENDSIGYLVDFKKKHGGFRFKFDIRYGYFSMRYELGFRPGVKNRMSSNPDAENNFLTRSMTGTYVTLGIGIGIGML